MKKQTLVLLAIAGGAILLLSMKKKPRYMIDVPAPERITEEEFMTKTQRTENIIQKAAPVVKSVLNIFKKKKKLTPAQQQTVDYLSSGRKLFGTGTFPDMC
jgi:hypothetical protein